MGSMYVVFVIAILVLIVLAKTAVVVPQQSALRRRDARALQPHAPGGLPHPGAVRRPHRLQAQPQGRGDRHPGADLHHARQRAGRRRRRAVPAGAGCEQGLLRHHELPLRDHPARADDAAQRDRQDRARPHLRGARRRSTRNVVAELDKASAPWGVKVLRYEIKNINPPKDVLAAMEKQMRAEREKRAVVLTSEGERDAKINQAEGDKQRVIKESEGDQAAADQRGAGPGRGDPRGRDRDRRGPEAGRRGACRPRRPRGDAAAHRRGVRQAVRQAREARPRARSSCPRTCRTSPR